MAGQIRMSPEELKSKATRYGQGANQIEDILRQLQNLQNELRGEWEGRAFEGFDQQFNQLKPKVQNFAQLLQEINMHLIKLQKLLLDMTKIFLVISVYNKTDKEIYNLAMQPYVVWLNYFKTRVRYEVFH